MRRLLLGVPFVFALIGLVPVGTVARDSRPAIGSVMGQPNAAAILGVSTCSTVDGLMCINVITSTARTVYNISNPAGITGFEEYHLVNFDQRLLASSPTSIDVQIVSEAFVDTRFLPYLRPCVSHRFTEPISRIARQRLCVVPESTPLNETQRSCQQTRLWVAELTGGVLDTGETGRATRLNLGLLAGTTDCVYLVAICPYVEL